MKIRTDFVTNSSSSSFTISIEIETENGKKIEIGKAHQYCEFAAEGKRYPQYQTIFGKKEKKYCPGKEEHDIDRFKKILFDGCCSYNEDIDKWLRSNDVVPRETIKIIYRISGDGEGEYYQTCFSGALDSAGLDEIIKNDDVQYLSSLHGLTENQIKKLKDAYKNGHEPIFIEREEYIYQGKSEYRIKIGDEYI